MPSPTLFPPIGIGTREVKRHPQHPSHGRFDLCFFKAQTKATFCEMEVNANFYAFAGKGFGALVDSFLEGKGRLEELTR